MLCGVLLTLLFSFAPAVAQQPSLAERLGLVERQPAGRPYYVEFRAGHEAIVFTLTGHSWITFGRVDPSGRALTTQRADLYPVEPQLGSIVGAVVPVRGHVRVRPGEGNRRPVATYRRYLSAGEYGRLQAALAHEQRSQRQWSLLWVNCNEFASTMAHTLGLRTPPTILLPQIWVSTLRLLNGR